MKIYRVLVEYRDTSYEYPQWSTLFLSYYSTEKRAEEELEKLRSEGFEKLVDGYNSFVEFDAYVSQITVND